MYLEVRNHEYVGGRVQNVLVQSGLSERQSQSRDRFPRRVKGWGHIPNKEYRLKCDKILYTVTSGSSSVILDPQNSLGFEVKFLKY